MNKKTDNTVSPKQQRSIKSKQSILKAAEKVFAEKGLHGARIDEIASFSGVNKQRIYAYFGSKDKLYRQVLMAIYSKASENKKLAQLTEKDIPKLTNIIIETFFEFHKKHPLFWRLLSWENLNGGKNLSNSDWKNIQAGYIQKLSQLYKIGQRKAVFRKDVDFSTYIIAIFAITYFYSSNQMTISSLLNLKLKNSVFKDIFSKQLNLLLSGCLIYKTL